MEYTDAVEMMRRAVEKHGPIPADKPDTWPDYIDFSARQAVFGTHHPVTLRCDDPALTFSDQARASGVVRVSGYTPEPVFSVAIERADAAKVERQRLRAALQELKPPHRPRTHGDWARGWREAGALEMWERLDALLEKGGA